MPTQSDGGTDIFPDSSFGYECLLVQPKNNGSPVQRRALHLDEFGLAEHPDGDWVTYNHARKAGGRTVSSLHCKIPATYQAVDWLHALLDVPENERIYGPVQHKGGGSASIQGAGSVTVMPVIYLGEIRVVVSATDDCDPYLQLGFECSTEECVEDSVGEVNAGPVLDCGAGGSGNGGGGSGGGGSAPSTAPSGVSQSEYDAMNESEQALCHEAGTLVCLTYLRVSRNALAWAESTGLPGPNDGPQDAVRHAYWQSELTKELNDAWAEVWGNAHETSSSNQLSTQMDQWNNVVGRTIGLQPGGSGPSVWLAYNNGTLRKVCGSSLCGTP